MDEQDRAEAAIRRRIEDSELPEPDEIVYRETDVVLVWHEHKLAVGVDLEKAAA